MEMNYKSQICTTRLQSERLFALGLKKETADMTIVGVFLGTNEDGTLAFEDVPNAHPPMLKKDIPAWSLHRLIEMLPSLIYPKEELPSFSGYAYLNLTPIAVWYHYIDYDMEDRTLISWRGNGIFSAVVDATEWLIKEGYFPKEYLV